MQRYTRFLTNYPWFGHLSTGTVIYVAYESFLWYTENKKRKNHLKYLKSLPDMQTAGEYEIQYHQFRKEHHPVRKIPLGMLCGGIMYVYHRMWVRSSFGTVTKILIDFFVSPVVLIHWFPLSLWNFAADEIYKKFIAKFTALQGKKDKEDQKGSSLLSRSLSVHMKDLPLPEYYEFYVTQARINESNKYTLCGQLLYLWISIINFYSVPSRLRGMVGIVQSLLFPIVSGPSLGVKIVL